MRLIACAGYAEQIATGTVPGHQQEIWTGFMGFDLFIRVFREELEARESYVSIRRYQNEWGTRF